MRYKKQNCIIFEVGEVADIATCLLKYLATYCILMKSVLHFK